MYMIMPRTGYIMNRLFDKINISTKQFSVLFATIILIFGFGISFLMLQMSFADN